MNPKQLVVPVEGGCDSESRLQMLNSFPSLALGPINVTEKVMRSADPIFPALVQKEFDCAGGSFFRGAKLSTIKQRPTKVIPALSLTLCIAKSFVNLQCSL